MPLTAFGPQQTGAMEPTDFGIYGFGGGLNIKAAPQELASNELMVALNGYLRTDGGFEARRGINLYKTLGTNPAMGLARFYQQVVNGATVSVRQTLAQVGGTLYNADTGAQIGPLNGLGASAQPWSVVRATDPNPQYFSGPTDVLVICTGDGGPYIYDGTNLYTPVGWASAAGARWCALVNGIVWFGGIPAQPNRINGTGYGQTVGDSFESLYNYREFLFSQPVVGLASVGHGANAGLAIGMNRGIGMLYGTSPSNFTIQEVPGEDGVQAGRTMLTYNGILFFLGRQAIYSFEGYGMAPQQISIKVEPWILNDPLSQGYRMRGDRTQAFAFIYNNKYHLAYDSLGTGVPQTILVFDLIVQGWTVLATGMPLQSACLLDAPGDASPAQAYVGDASTGNVYAWDALNADTTCSDNGVAFLVSVQTKYFKLGEPGTIKSLLRYYPELFIAGSFSGNATVQTDYGTGASSSLVSPLSRIINQGALWGTAIWGVDYWTASMPYTYFGAPRTRIDISGIQADAFSFGILSNQIAAPWVFAGLTGTYLQEGRV